MTVPEFAGCARSNHTPFIIVGRSRVGSNLLRGLLNSHPNVATYGEVFRELGAMDWDHLGHFQSAAMRRLIRRDPVRFVDRKVFGPHPRNLQAVGFKIFYYHARDGSAAGLWPYLRARPDLRVIHLTRRNLLETHVSRKRAVLTDRWVNTTGITESPVALRLDYGECLEDFRTTRAWEDECVRGFSTHPMLFVQYEVLAERVTEEAGRIQEFLGVQPRLATPSTFRQIQQPLSTVIVNYSELKERFQGTEWAEFFTD